MAGHEQGFSPSVPIRCGAQGAPALWCPVQEEGLQKTPLMVSAPEKGCPALPTLLFSSRQSASVTCLGALGPQQPRLGAVGLNHTIRVCHALPPICRLGNGLFVSPLHTWGAVVGVG